MDSNTLYSLSEELTLALEAIDAAECDEDRALIIAECEPVMAAMVRKVDHFCQYLAHLESQVAFAKAEASRLAARQKVASARLERLKAYALDVMGRGGFEKLEGEANTLSRRKNPPALAITAPDLVPDKYRIVVPETTQLDNVAIKAALRAGVDVPGATLTVGESLVRT